MSLSCQKNKFCALYITDSLCHYIQFWKLALCEVTKGTQIFSSERISQSERAETQPVRRHDVTLGMKSFLGIFWSLEITFSERLKVHDFKQTVERFIMNNVSARTLFHAIPPLATGKFSQKKKAVTSGPLNW